MVMSNSIGYTNIINHIMEQSLKQNKLDKSGDGKDEIALGLALISMQNAEIKSKNIKLGFYI